MLLETVKNKEASFAMVSMTADSQLRMRDIESFCENNTNNFHQNTHALCLLLSINAVVKSYPSPCGMGSSSVYVLLLLVSE